jgi:hypothetical protein
VTDKTKIARNKFQGMVMVEQRMIYFLIVYFFGGETAVNKTSGQ